MNKEIEDIIDKSDLGNKDKMKLKDYIQHLMDGGCWNEINYRL